LHELLFSAGSRIDVTISRNVTLSRPGIRIHRSAHLHPEDLLRRSGIPCTSVPRTLLDLAAVVPRPVLERACEQAEVKRLVDWSAMETLLRRAGGRRGVRNLRASLPASPVQGTTRSELERRFLGLCRRAALPSPVVNAWLTVAGEEMQVDFVWHESRLIVETDGFRTHGTHQAFSRDRSRDRLLSLAGWRVARFTWNDVTEEPEKVVGQVRRLLKTRPAPSLAAWSSK
jgi:very-short-patch-repair endonuclease